MDGELSVVESIDESLYSILRILQKIEALMIEDQKRDKKQMKLVQKQHEETKIKLNGDTHTG